MQISVVNRRPLEIVKRLLVGNKVMLGRDSKTGLHRSTRNHSTFGKQMRRDMTPSEIRGINPLERSGCAVKATHIAGLRFGHQPCLGETVVTQCGHIGDYERHLSLLIDLRSQRGSRRPSGNRLMSVDRTQRGFLTLTCLKLALSWHAAAEFSTKRR